MNFKAMFFAIITFSLIIIALGVAINQQAVRYGSSVESDLGEYSKLDEVSTTSLEQKGTISTQSGEASSDFETETFRGVYGIITGMFSPLRIVFGSDGMIQSLGERYGLPSWLLQGIVAMFMVAITFGIVAIIFRLGRESV